MTTALNVRPERPADAPAIRAVNEAAFDTDAEARLVELLRAQVSPIVSLVAEERGATAGHILFSPVTLVNQPDLGMMGLAPMAVRPDRQRHGIGSALVVAGLDACRRLGAAGVVVLGHPTYYPRFGFVPASRFGLTSEYDVADDVFMALELQPGRLGGRSGTIRFHPAFSTV